MSSKARHEYIGDMRRRYAAATRAGRRRLLDEVVAMTGYHRKYAIALLRREPCPPKRRRRRRTYGPEVVAALVKLWKAAGYPWSTRLKAMLPTWLPWLQQRGVDSLTAAALARMSARSIDRCLRAKRGETRRRLYGHTRPGILLKQEVAIRAERWDVGDAGWSELDLVAHCGGSGFGEFINSLNLTDIASGWTETRAICGKGERGVVAAIDAIRRSLPFVLRGIDSDSGSEFINHHCVRYCRAEPALIFTRSRPYKKNDNAHVEQKNWTHVRKIFGWGRLEGADIAQAMNRLYAGDLRIWMNYFQPSCKLVRKQRVGSRVRKYYDVPQAPLDRLIAMGTLSEEQRHSMLAHRAAIDPFALSRRLDTAVATILATPQPTIARAAHAHDRGVRMAPFNRKGVLIRRAALGGGKILNGATT